jgi:hypothetical protein
MNNFLIIILIIIFLIINSGGHGILSNKKINLDIHPASLYNNSFFNNSFFNYLIFILVLYILFSYNKKERYIDSDKKILIKKSELILVLILIFIYIFRNNFKERVMTIDTSIIHPASIRV